MPGPFNFDAFLGWVNITDPNNVPQDARVVGADDLLRYENLGLATKEKFAEIETELSNLDSDTAVATSLAQPESQTRAAVQDMVDEGVTGFQAVIDAVPATVEAQVPPLVADAIAADPTVAAAAATAANTAIAGADLVKGGDPRIPSIGPDKGYAKIVKDADEKLAMGIRNDGSVYIPQLDADSFTVDTLTAPELAATAKFTAAGQATTAGPGLNQGGYAKVWLDASEKMAMGITDTGTVVIPSLSAPELQIAEPELRAQVPARRNAAGALVRLESRSDLIMTDGDSITMGAGDELSLGGWPGRMATLIGSRATVYNQGLSARTSTELVFRQGGVVPLVTVTANTIPASGPVAVTQMTPATSYRHANSTPGIWEWEGTLAGIPGKLKHDIQSASPSGGWSFERTTAGAATPVPKESPFIMTLADAYREATLILWYGRNNGGVQNDYMDTVRDTRAAIAHLTPDQPRFLVVSILTNSVERRDGSSGNQEAYGKVMTANNALAARYGDRFLDVRKYLITNGLADAGLTPTPQDLLDIASDTVPASLRADETHPNAKGYTVIANYIYQALLAKGWITA
jgi:hypothetical protein